MCSVYGSRGPSQKTLPVKKSKTTNTVKEVNYSPEEYRTMKMKLHKELQTGEAEKLKKTEKWKLKSRRNTKRT